jgi:hypothetical protein
MAAAIQIGRFKVHLQPSNYRFVHEYLTWARRALNVARDGGTVRIRWATEYQGGAFIREFTAALHARINHKAGINPTGRKFTQDYQIGLRRDADRLRDIARRVRVYQFETPELTRRFGHKLSKAGE